MLRAEKKDFINKLGSIYSSSESIIITHYHGLSVQKLTNLRKSLRNNGVGFQVTKNTLAKIALNNSGLSFASDSFKGPVAIAYSSDCVAAAKGVVDFAKANENLKIVGGVVNNRFLTVAEVEILASLPSMDVLRSKIIGVINAPAAKLASISQAPAAQLARVMKAYAEKN